MSVSGVSLQDQGSLFFSRETKRSKRRSKKTKKKRNSIRDFMVFTTRTVYSKVKDSKASVQEKDYFCHCLKGKDGLGAVIIADAEYKQMLAFGLMTDLVIQFKKKFDMRSPPIKAKCSKDHQFDEAFPELAKLLVDCQDPRKVDKVLKIRNSLVQIFSKTLQPRDALWSAESRHKCRCMTPPVARGEGPS